jgi:hypothetical protein
MSITTHYTFEEVKRKVKKTGKCRCGKKITRATTLFQTINPYNKNKDGFPKNMAEIYNELDVDAAAWTPDFTCAACREKEQS